MWNTLFYEPIVNLLLFLYKLVGENLGFSIIAITLFLRIVLAPLTVLQLNSSKKMQELQPKLQKLQKKDKSQMTMKELGAVKDMGKGCAFGCLPTLVQLPFLFSLYQALRTLSTSNGTVFNPIAYTSFLMFADGYNFNTMFFGLDLAIIPSEIGFKTAAVIPYLLLAILVAGSQWATTKIMSPQKVAGIAGKAKDGDKSKGKGKNKKSDQEMQADMMKTTGTYMQVMFPLMIGFASFSVPAALGLYWLMQSVFLLAQIGITNGVKHLINRAKEGRENIEPVSKSDRNERRKSEHKGKKKKKN